MGKFKNEPGKQYRKTYEQDKDFMVDPETGELIVNPDGGGIGPIDDNTFTEEASVDGITNEDLEGISRIKPESNVADIRSDEISLINYQGLIDGNEGKSSSLQDAVSKAVTDYNQAITDYSKYLEGSPTFVTYFRINKRISTIDTSLGGIVETVGADSPIVYDKITNFPIWNIEELNAVYSYDEFTGIDTDLQTSGIVLPNSIVPKPDEYVYIEYNSKKILLKVNNVEPTNILSTMFYRINMTYSSADISFLNAQVGNVLQYNYDDGTLNNVAQETINTALKTLLSDIMIKYIHAFFKKQYNSFVFNDCYDKFLHRFIHDTHLFIVEKTFMTDIYVEPTLPFNVSEDTRYSNSIYERIISRRDKKFISHIAVMPFGGRNIYNVFNMGRNQIREIVHSDATDIPILTTGLLDENVNASIVTPSERIIRNYMMTGDLDYLTYFDDLKELQVEYYLKDYIQIPLVIYILKKVIANVKK